MNPRLRMVLLKCRAANMPNDNIDRAIKRGTGGGEAIEYTDLTYEVYGPHGVAMLVELSTDNRNRTAAEIRSIADQKRRDHRHGRLGHAGFFSARGRSSCCARRRARIELMELALEAGAEDFTADEGGLRSFDRSRRAWKRSTRQLRPRGSRRRQPK